MTPGQRYATDLERPDFEHDDAQATAVASLQRVYEALCASNLRYPFTTRAKLRLFPASRGQAPVRGLYMYGGVGRGKTYLMDVFYDCIDDEHKLRRHFHRFMQGIHAELKALSGKSNPLRIVAEKLAKSARVICFDEFFVSDIADAMLLGTLFEELFRRGVTLVATSNIPPDELYRDGLQRNRFLPTIELIKQHTQVLHVDGPVDFRLRVLEQAEIYHSPLDEKADASLNDSFDRIAQEPGIDNFVLQVEGRPVQTRRRAHGVVWFDFEDICGGPRSQTDYIQIASWHHTVLISNLPQLDSTREDQARRFIALVDEFYDRRINLIISAATAVEAIYAGRRLGFEFERTLSRLREMQSHEYLAQAHIP